jgi:hypothetical protein
MSCWETWWEDLLPHFQSRNDHLFEADLTDNFFGTGKFSVYEKKSKQEGGSAVFQIETKQGTLWRLEWLPLTPASCSVAIVKQWEIEIVWRGTLLTFFLPEKEPKRTTDKESQKRPKERSFEKEMSLFLCFSSSEMNSQERGYSRLVIKNISCKTMSAKTKSNPREKLSIWTFSVFLL